MTYFLCKSNTNLAKHLLNQVERAKLVGINLANMWQDNEYLRIDTKDAEFAKYLMQFRKNKNNELVEMKGK